MQRIVDAGGCSLLLVPSHPNFLASCNQTTCAYFGGGGHIFSYLGPARLEQQLVLRSVHPDVGRLRGQLPHPLVVNVCAFQESIEVVVLTSLMMVITVQPSCTSYVTAGALRILNHKNTNNERKKMEKRKTNRSATAPSFH